MGKFGKNKLPKFMETPDTRMGSNPHIQEDTLGDMLHPQIVSMSDHGDDHAMIVIRTKDGEELELQFNYDGEGLLTAQHGEHDYSIPVEVEYTETSEVDEKLKGKQKNLDKNHNGKIDAEDFKLLNKSKKEESGKVAETFESFVNECWTPMEEGYNIAMSEPAKRAIKALCEEVLIQEAKRCDEDADPMHTYENYLNECGSYMTECMMEAAASVPITESEHPVLNNELTSWLTTTFGPNTKNGTFTSNGSDITFMGTALNGKPISKIYPKPIKIGVNTMNNTKGTWKRELSQIIFTTA